jgi:phosphatidylserine decarboxylase
VGDSPESVFRERLTGRFAPEVWTTAAPLAALGLGVAWLVAPWAGAALLAAAAGVAAFFRNPERDVPGGEGDVVAPADGRVIEVGEVEEADGRKGLRIGIFLSIFDVHVNRAPVAGRVVAVERSSGGFLAAFRPEAPLHNVRLDMLLETAAGERVRVVQITGLVARRIVCQPRVGEWLRRGVRYGLIRFGSRTDVVLPAGSRACVVVGGRVRGGSTLIARLPGAPA